MHGCTHCFHAECVAQWRKSQLLDQQCCPECRNKPRLEPITRSEVTGRDSDWWSDTSSVTNSVW